MPKKKKKGKDKEKKVRKSRHMNEKDTLTYEQEILDNNKQIARLRARNQELENEMEIATKKLQQLEEDRSDVIAHLKRHLQHKIEEAQELNERLYALEELRKEEMTAFKKKEEELEEEFRTMENNLTTEIQLSAGKLSALEEWRIARNDLLKKFETQEKQMEEQEKRHKEQLYEVEKNLIISKIKLQKEMEERLNQLAHDFRETINLRIADTTKRAIHENIAINKELDVMFKVCRNVNAKICEYKQRDYRLKLKTSMYESEAKRALKKVMKQNQLIQKLTKDHYTMRALSGKMKGLEKKKELHENLAREYEEKYNKSQERIKLLEGYVEEAKENNRKILKDMEINSKDIIKLKEVIKRAKECIKTVLKLNAEEDENSLNSLEEKEKFLRTMLDILGSDFHFRTDDNLYEDEDIMKYTQGSLGLVCHQHLDKKNDILKADTTNNIPEQDKANEGNIITDEQSCQCKDIEELETSDYFPFDSDSSNMMSFDESDAEEKVEK